MSDVMSDTEFVAALAEATTKALKVQRAAHAEALAAARTEMAAMQRALDERSAQLEEMIRAIPAGAPGAPGERGADGVPGERGADGAPGERGADGKDAVLDVEAVVKEVLPLIPVPKDGAPGAPGEKGADGRDGRDGTPGRDGITMEQVELAAGRIALKMVSELKLDGRTLKFGDQSAEIPIPIYRDVWREERAPYGAGDMVTFGGSLWHANAPTTEKPGEGKTAWTLVVKRGANGRDAK